MRQRFSEDQEADGEGERACNLAFLHGRTDRLVNERTIDLTSDLVGEGRMRELLTREVQRNPKQCMHRAGVRGDTGLARRVQFCHNVRAVRLFTQAHLVGGASRHGRALQRAGHVARRRRPRVPLTTSLVRVW